MKNDGLFHMQTYYKRRSERNIYLSGASAEPFPKSPYFFLINCVVYVFIL